MTSTVPEYAGCPWPMDPACITDEWGAFDEAVQDRALALASDTLHRLSGYRVGGCPITVRPGRQRGSCAPRHAGTYDRLFSAWAGHGADARRVRLVGPIGRIDMVRIGTTILDPSEYRVEGNDLVRLGVDGAWPQDPDMYAPLGSPNTWSVTYLNAYPVDSNAAYAVGLLALEFARACTGKGKCSLPPGVISIVRQGITMEMTSGVFPDGKTGIRNIDTWISLWNPLGLSAPTRVYSPDIPRLVVVDAPVIP